MGLAQKIIEIEAIAQQSRTDAALNVEKKNVNMNSRPLDVYCDCFGLDLPRYVLWKHKQLQRPIVVADFCCGYGTAMGQLKEKASDAVYCIGFDILYYPEHDLQTESFIVADLKNIPHSVLPQLPEGCIDIALSLFGMPFRFDAHIPNEHLEENVRLNIIFFQEIERLLAPKGEGYFHTLAYAGDSLDKIQSHIASYLQLRTIMMSEGSISHVYMKRNNE